ncbi:MAG: DUF1592 domain-containing protein [Myxococcales bacterium]|nr:DUF1592 domain-containing protein [Myxococcales bacterium]
MNRPSAVVLYPWFVLAMLGLGCAADIGSGPSGSRQSDPAAADPSSTDPSCQTPDCGADPGVVGSDSPVPGAGAQGQGPGARGPGSLFEDGQPAAGCAPNLAGLLGDTPLRRLTQTQYQKTVEDLFSGYGIAVGSKVGDDVPDDGLAGPFPSNAAVVVSEQHVRAYQTSAEALVPTVTAEANLPKLLTACSPASEDARCAEAFVSDFARKAFRRPLDSDQQEALMLVYQAGAETGFQDGIALVVEAVLQSPEFLYHVETKVPKPMAATELDANELAARTSYFLWNSLPDAELTRAARAGELSDDGLLRAQAQRMLSDPKGERTIRLFTHHWLALRHAATTDLHRDEFPGYTGPSYNDAAIEETHVFMQHMLRGAGEGTLEALFTASFGFPTPELAAVYGSEPSDGASPVELPPGERAGLLTQAGFLLAHSDPEFKTSAIRRGTTVANNFLCFAFSLPDNIEIDLNIPDGEPGQTARDRLEQHTAEPACQGCHGTFNPIGFTFDRFDAIGKIRDTDPHGNRLRDDAVLAIGDSAVDGPTMGPLDLGQKIASSDRGKSCMVRQMYRHALRRLDSADDTCALVEVAQRFAASDFDVTELMLEIVTSDGFRKRPGG